MRHMRIDLSALGEVVVYFACMAVLCIACVHDLNLTP